MHNQQLSEHDDWLSWRRGGIGSSDAAVIKKLFPFGKTPYQLWQQRMLNKENSDNEAMSHGRKYESKALDWFEKKMNCTLFRQIRVENAEKHWIRATLDGYDFEKKILVEAKVPYNLSNHKKVKETKKIPDIYYPQCQHQLVAAQGSYGIIPGSYFISYNWQNEEDSIIIENPRSDSYIAELIPDEEEFWNCILNKEAPELTERDFIPMKSNKEWELLEMRWIENNEVLCRAKQLDEEIRKSMISLSDNRNAQGYSLKISNSICEGNIDYKKMKEDYPNLPWESYRKESFIKWNFRATS